MTLPVKLPNMQQPPQAYNPEYVDGLLKELLLYFRALNTPGPLSASSLNLTALQTGGYGLVVGQVYEADGVLKVVRTKDVFFSPLAAAVSAVGTVTTTP